MENILQLVSADQEKIVLHGLSSTCSDHKHHTYLLDEALQVAKYIYPAQERLEVDRGSAVSHYELMKNLTETAEKLDCKKMIFFF